MLEHFQIIEALLWVLGVGGREYGEPPKAQVSFCGDGDRGTAK